MTKPVITWNTTKTAEGYQWRVIAVGYQIPTETLKTGTASSRAIATRLAKQWTLYLKRRAA